MPPSALPTEVTTLSLVLSLAPVGNLLRFQNVSVSEHLPFFGVPSLLRNALYVVSFLSHVVFFLVGMRTL